MKSSSVVIVSPALADANNGNWQTARRWRDMLARRHPVRITRQWPDDLAEGDDVMLALHARRSAAAVEAWWQARGPAGLGVVLTGTDLYHDLAIDASARRSLELASRLVVLQELAPAALPAALRPKTRVILQSTSGRPTLAKTGRWLRALMVGHLRAVKSPETLFAAARLLAGRNDILIDHVGAAQEPGFAEQARATARDCPGYRWLEALPHGQVRQRIQRAHVLVHASAMEGGAHVIMEALRSGTPVLASRVDGNVGMLGADYAGYFPHGDAGALATLLETCRADQRGGAAATGLLTTLQDQSLRRAGLFTAEAEREALRQLLAELDTGDSRTARPGTPGAEGTL